MSAIDDVLDTWEQMEDSGELDRKLQNLNVKPTAKNDNTKSTIIILAENMKSEFTPPRPRIQILKRPDSNIKTNGPLTNGERQKQPIKTFEQREQEYAETRKRIFGEEQQIDEKSSSEVNKIQIKPNLQVGNIQNSISLPSNVIRLPMGPDGTKGFNIRR